MDYRKLTTKTTYFMVQSYVVGKKEDIRQGNKHVVSVPQGVDLHFWLWNYAKLNPHLSLDADTIKQLENTQKATKYLGNTFIFEYRILENEVYTPYDKVPDHIRKKKRKQSFEI